MKITDIVHLRESGEFRSDIQLRWYTQESSENLDLVKRYIFSRTSAGEQKSPIDILYEVRQAFLLDNHENRFVIVATYGHGKSHLALAMANFFGKNHDSEELTFLASSIRSAFSNDPEGESYIEFKQSRKRHLVLCLEGTRPGDLGQLFLSALNTALRNEPETANLRPPFWIEEARNIIAQIAADETGRSHANRFLRDKATDIAALLQRLEEHDVSVYDLVRELCQHIHGFQPDMGGQVSLATVEEWAANTLCGPEDNKPFSGILILFDEFSAFVRNYALRETPGTPLQDLLDGVANLKGKVVFIAFGQTDPNTSVLNVLRQSEDDHFMGALLLELERLPRRCRFHLYTTMESVLDAYLDQNKNLLKQAIDNGNAWPAVLSANDDCLSLFRKRYEQELKWSSEKFQDVVTLGAFPLHPVTTALLCNIELLESANPRSVLGFIFEQLSLFADKPPVLSRRPTWVYGCYLVDWFKEQLADDSWQQYQEAMRQRGGDLTSKEGAILKAMLLHTISRMPTQPVDFVGAICHLTGMERAEVEKNLGQLAEATVIEHVAPMRKYSFWPLGGGARPLIDLISRTMAGRSMHWAQWKNATAKAELVPVPVDVPWGHSGDWAAPQILLTREFAGKEKIIEMTSGAPGAIVWLVARNDDDVEWFDHNAPQIVGEFGGTSPLPFVLMCPSRPTPLLPEILFRIATMEALPPNQLTQYGTEAIQTVKGRLIVSLRDQVDQLIKSNERYCVPTAYDAALRAAPPVDHIGALAQYLYKLAYSSAPPAFFTQYNNRAVRLRTAVKMLGRLLLKNEVYTDRHESNPVAVGLVDKFLVQGKSESWGILTIGKRLQEPQHARTRAAWDILDKAIPTNGKEALLSGAVLKLKLPPFGYNESTLALLFCAWYGYYRHYLRISVAGAIKTSEILEEWIEQSPAKLIELLDSSVRFKRKDPGDTTRKVRELIGRSRNLANDPLTKQDAIAAIAKLAEFLGDEHNSQAEREQAQEAKNIIEDALQRADRYDADVCKLRSDAQSADVISLIRLIKELGGVKAYCGVKTNEPGVAAVREELMQLLAANVAGYCLKYQDLPSLTEYEQRHAQLMKAKTAIREFVDLQAQIERAIKHLENKKSELEAKQKDAATIAYLRGMSVTAPLKELREAKEYTSSAQCFSEEAKTLRIEKNAELKKVIDKMESFAASLESRLATVTDVASAAKLRESITERRLFFAGSPEERIVGAALTRCGHIEKFLAELGGILVDTFRTQADRDSCANRLSQLRANVVGQLSDEQESLLKKAEEKIERRVAALAKEARGWLDTMRSRVQDCKDPEGLLAELNRPPEFLPEDKKAEVAAIASQAQQILEAKQKDAATISYLRGLSATSPLKELRGALEGVARAVCFSDEAKKLQKKKEAELQEAIDTLVSIAKNLEFRISNVKTAADLAQVKETITERRLFYAGSPEAQMVEVSLSRCVHVERCLRSLEAIPINKFRNPAESDDRLKELARIHASAEGQLSPLQTQLISAAEETIRSTVESLIKKAYDWLTEMQARVQNCQDPERLLSDLRHIPDFLPEEKKQEVAAIASQVNQMLDQDVCVNIRRLFGRIGDVKTKQQLLQELQASVSEGQSI